MVAKRPTQSGSKARKPAAAKRSTLSRRNKPPAPANDRLAIVGVGASAGGLEAFSSLLSNLPSDTGLGFVLVQHLDPQHESALAQILTRATPMPVREVTDNLAVEANRVYIIPPNTALRIQRGVLKLGPRSQTRGPVSSIDAFFQSLAQDQRERAIGVILSGTAFDGTVGLESIKAEGGITFAQDNSAKYDSMPRNAVAAGCVDFVLSPAEIATELARIAQHPYVTRRSQDAESDRTSAVRHADDASPLPAGGRGTPRNDASKARAEATHSSDDERAQPGFKKILSLLRNHAGVDFSLYKSSTIQRRVARRLVLNKQHTLEDYARLLRDKPKELDALYSDVLISVTSFFRNPEMFHVLATKIFPKLLRERSEDPLRVWVLGCSTGQEAYSIAMTFVEAVDKAARPRSLQVFATDLNDALLDKARHGLYDKSLAQDVSPERLRRFFIEEQGGYRVNKALRESVVFARQNLIADPPFSRMDLISCRNLLIYLEPRMQKKVLPTFHYALKPAGYLLLGASESIGTFTELFEPADKKHKIFSKKAAPVALAPLPLWSARAQQGTPRTAQTVALEGQPRRPSIVPPEISAQREADRVTVLRFAPPGVLINAELQILQFRGATAAYLQPPTGKASFDVLKMAREGLMLPLRGAIQEAKKSNQIARRQRVRMKQSGGARMVDLEVIPLKNLRERCFLILFADASHAARPTTSRAAAAARRPIPTSREDVRRVHELERELAEMRDFVQSIQEQHEAANEELQASSEEMQSANEELQSVNEELETSKEELESANEELITVNEEMSNRNLELHRLNSDLTNLQTSTQLAIVLLGRDLTVRRFSPLAEKQFRLSAGDLGRPFGTVRHSLVLAPSTESAPADLEALIADVIEHVQPAELDVRDKRDGHWFSLRLRPYFTLDNQIDGAVLVLVDIDVLKRSEQEIVEKEDALRRSHAELQARAEELDRFNRVAVGREVRMIELKREVNSLRARLGEAGRYPLDFEIDPDQETPSS